MADENTSDVKPAKGAKNAPPADTAPTTITTSEPESSSAVANLNGVLRDVEATSNVRDGVKLLVEKLADLMTRPKSDAEYETLALEVQERAEAFADAVKENAAELAARPSNTPDAPFQASQAQSLTEEELLARNHSAPHNDAAAAAVEAGMDTRTANEMTQVGSNI